MNALVCALALVSPNPSPFSGEIRLGLHQNLLNQTWRSNNRPYGSGSLPPGLVDFGELRIQPAFPSGKFRLVGFSGYRKGGWMSPDTQPSPTFLDYEFWESAAERASNGRPSKLKWTNDGWRLKLTKEWPYLPTPDTWGFPVRKVVHAEDRQEFVETRTEFWYAKEAGTYSFKLEPPLEFFKGSFVRHWSVSGQAMTYRAAVTNASGKPTAPKESYLYFSEFEPFLFDPAFPAKLKKLFESQADFEYWVLARTNQIVRLRAVYRGLQQLKFREIDMPARRYDIAGFRKDDKGRWDVLATVWVDKDDWKFVLADNTMALAKGLINAEALFRLEPEPPSDFNWVYPPFQKTEKFLKEPIEPGGSGSASKGGGTP